MRMTEGKSAYLLFFRIILVLKLVALSEAAKTCGSVSNGCSNLDFNWSFKNQKIMKYTMDVTSVSFAEGSENTYNVKIRVVGEQQIDLKYLWSLKIFGVFGPQSTIQLHGKNEGVSGLITNPTDFKAEFQVYGKTSPTDECKVWLPSFQVNYEYLQGDAAQYSGDWKWGTSTFDLSVGCDNYDNQGHSQTNFPSVFWSKECGKNCGATAQSSSLSLFSSILSGLSYSQRKGSATGITSLPNDISTSYNIVTSSDVQSDDTIMTSNTVTNTESASTETHFSSSTNLSITNRGSRVGSRTLTTSKIATSSNTRSKYNPISSSTVHDSSSSPGTDSNKPATVSSYNSDKAKNTSVYDSTSHKTGSSSALNSGKTHSASRSTLSAGVSSTLHSGNADPSSGYALSTAVVSSTLHSGNADPSSGYASSTTGSPSTMETSDSSSSVRSFSNISRSATTRYWSKVRPSSLTSESCSDPLPPSSSSMSATFRSTMDPVFTSLATSLSTLIQPWTPSYPVSPSSLSSDMIVSSEGSEMFPPSSSNKVAPPMTTSKLPPPSSSTVSVTIRTTTGPVFPPSETSLSTSETTSYPPPPASSNDVVPLETSNEPISIRPTDTVAATANSRHIIPSAGSEDRNDSALRSTLVTSRLIESPTFAPPIPATASQKTQKTPSTSENSDLKFETTLHPVTTVTPVVESDSRGYTRGETSTHNVYTFAGIANSVNPAILGSIFMNLLLVLL
ncbi:uncharacterized protein KNAG_0M00100 [Huiozyma naganishii CBS 8797]|uniref:Flo11 domain-containing protein n=1 Tax=Huiozyma naganishii (strain ATCC MYA-139 / BCRC 22969 / CBS 8797 / KCTC 17520 / NBRC 10181 / NCYC 3082 / Yp74L-3) TaxID=1071383 RepID=J7RSG6_HUIN7|nr:hypothetical protein KNAG_0M00100 [Kazachstania naganishii CBS 8797]CCK72863.1 hypothetical protein KNAG_0M00100 [Kazachstania naganishii CBS 8797]